LIQGDLSKLSPEQKLSYYKSVCESVGLNPLTNPFSYIVLNDRETLYANKSCTDQLRKIHKVSVEIVKRENMSGTYVVTARAYLPDGRYDESIGAVNLGNLKGDNLANALMKGETKAKRRVTLSICGLSMLDETEVETIKEVGFQSENKNQPSNQNQIKQKDPSSPADKQAIKKISELLVKKGFNSSAERIEVLMAYTGKDDPSQLTLGEARNFYKFVNDNNYQEIWVHVEALQAEAFGKEVDSESRFHQEEKFDIPNFEDYQG